LVGGGLWATYALNDYINPGIRAEVFRDQNGANRLGTNTLFTPPVSVNQTAKEIALVNKFIVNKNTAIRLEYRHDWSTAPA